MDRTTRAVDDEGEALRAYLLFHHVVLHDLSYQWHDVLLIELLDQHHNAILSHVRPGRLHGRLGWFYDLSFLLLGHPYSPC